MESPPKRQKPPPPTVTDEDDFVPLEGENEVNEHKYGYDNDNTSDRVDTSILQPPRAPRAMYQNGANFSHGYGHGHLRNSWFQRMNAKDAPKSRHDLPGHEPWVLVRTKLGRRFVHNTATGESLWRIPKDVFAGVLSFEQWEAQQEEKNANARWAEDQLKEMRQQSKAEEVVNASHEEGRNRGRRSESLQREDEEAMLAELAAEAEKAEEQDAKEAVKAVESVPQRPSQAEDGYDSESSYEEVEVTDSEGEEGKDQASPSGEAAPEDTQTGGAVEFGEDDIAYQLAAMGEDYGLDPGEYGEVAQDEDEEWEEDVEGLPLSDEDAANLFRDMLDDHRISPFTPWEKLISDESENGILMDDRYTVLPNMRTRRAVWESWVKDTAARLKEERATMEKRDPRIPYLAFLAERATPKLYWPEFKRKFKKDAVMTDRQLSDKEREKLYRDHINRLKLPESTRKADLLSLLESIPRRVLHRHSSLDALPEQLLSHLHFISLPVSVRDQTIGSHISSLPPAPSDGEDGMLTEEQLEAEERKRAERRKREVAMDARRKEVDAQRREAEKEERWARKGLMDEERELQKAMAVGNRGLTANLKADDERRE